MPAESSQPCACTRTKLNGEATKSASTKPSRVLEIVFIVLILYDLTLKQEPQSSGLNPHRVCEREREREGRGETDRQISCCDHRSLERGASSIVCVDSILCDEGTRED